MNSLQKLKWLVSDTIAIIRRNLIHYTRLPQLVVFSTIQPVMFLLLFTYVFGGAIKSNSAEYILYLLPGVLVQTILFGSMQTGIGLANDLSKGMIDRFRSLPMAHSAILIGRTLTDTIRNSVVIILMVTVGYIIGFRITHGFAHFALGIVSVLFFGFSFSWISAAIGLWVKNVETAQVAGFIWIFPLVFASSIFVPINTMPHWLQIFAAHTPVTLTANTIRALTFGQPYFTDLWQSALWALAILVAFVPLAVRLYKKA